MTVCPSDSLPVRLSACLTVCPLGCLSIRLSARQTVCRSDCLSISLSVRQTVCLSDCLPVRLSACQTVSPSNCLSTKLYVCQTVCPSACLSVRLSVQMSTLSSCNSKYLFSAPSIYFPLTKKTKVTIVLIYICLFFITSPYSKVALRKQKNESGYKGSRDIVETEGTK